MSEIGQSFDQPTGAQSPLIISRPVLTHGLEEAPYALAWARQHSKTTPKVKILTSVADAREEQLSADELWLWVGEVPDLLNGDMVDLREMLDEETRIRLSRLAREQDQASIGIAHASLRLLLGAILDIAPSALAFQRGPHGKPYLVSNNDGSDRLHFNLSHTQGAVAIALAREPVGVDIEIQRDLPDLLEICETVFARKTITAIANAANASQRRTLFYRHWTLGEALIKATGGGMSHDLKSFAFSSRGAPQLCLARGEFAQAERWAFGLYGVGNTSKHQSSNRTGSAMPTSTSRSPS